MNIYPTDEQLEKIRKWEVLSDNDFIALMKYVHSLWEYADYGYWLQSEKNVFIIATAGWSGNEDIISALQENVMFWTLYWYQSQRGGKYIFCPQSVHLPAFENRITELETELARLREERRWRKCSELPEDKQLCEVVDKYGDVSLWIYSGALNWIFLHKFKYWRPFEYPPGQNVNHQNTK